MDDDAIIEETSAAEDWAKAEALFPARHVLKLHKASTIGISSRLSRGRVSRLLDMPAAGRLAAQLDQMDDERVKAMRTFAAINLEQAASAFRITLIANITAPLLLVTFLNQIIVGGFSELMKVVLEAYQSNLLALIIVIFLSILFLTGLATYALANLNQARDLRHLIDLLAAERGIYFGLEDIDDLHSP